MNDAAAIRDRDIARAELVRLRAEMGAALVNARAEVERLRAENANNRADVTRFRDGLAQVCRELKAAESERDRLRAVLADTHDNLWATAKVASRNGRVENADRDAAHAILAALRARAGQP